MIAKGGNAFDAAVAVTAALAVVEPYSSGLGGGGFWLIHRAEDGFQTMIDGRETTPLQGHRDMYLDEKGNVIPKLSMNGPLSAGIPGVPAAIVHLARKYGKLPLSTSLAPAIRYAREGFEVDTQFERMAKFRKKVLAESVDAKRIFLLNGDVPPVGHVIKQPDLAVTLEAIAQKGREGFYKGPIARQLIRGVQSAGGIWTQEDLDKYKVIEREPIRGEYKGMKITSAAPPSSGGIALVEMFNILSGLDIEHANAVTRKHLIVEAMRRAYRDRAQYLGDTDFVKVPVDMLTSPLYAAGLRAGIRADKAMPSADLPGINAPRDESFHTTHFSVLDADGNRVSATVTINYPFGSGFVAPGTGVLLNDEMDDFSAKPGVPNAYGLVGAEANAIAPGKRPLSSMSPSFLETKDGLAIIGTPGGSRIITMVLLGALDFYEGNGPTSWVSL
ncbi:MAG: gamma-glutamyltransferase, partial [Gammaproteobacteria bacterium]|nr:gamma-glutamyltransferase [Gammaproteobacteria bacterium]